MPKKQPKNAPIALERLTVEVVPINAVKPNSYNPNRQGSHEFELLCKSIRMDGFTQPVIALADTKVIVDGEHRWRAAQAIGMTEIPVVFVPMTAEQARIATLRHNRARGSEDAELVAAMMRDLKAVGVDLDAFAEELMVSTDELEDLIADLPEPEALSDPAVQDAQDAIERADAIRLAEARNEAEKRDQQERQGVKERDIYIVSVSFAAGEESELVQRVLGDRPAEVLLELCREAAA